MRQEKLDSKHFIYDVTTRMEYNIGESVSIQNSNKDDYNILILSNVQFVVDTKVAIRQSNKVIVINQIQELKQRSSKPVITIAKFIAIDIAQEFKEKGYNYVDAAGNCYINYDNILIYIVGQKVKSNIKTNQSRAFQEAGIKLIFNLLQYPDNIQLSYRKLAELTNISIGSVSNVITELEELKFLVKTKEKRRLKNTALLLERWVIAYSEVLRPRILKKKMRFSDPENYNNFAKLLSLNSKTHLWGGEPAAAILTQRLKPSQFLIYTKENWQTIASELKLIPDDNGDIEILSYFENYNSFSKVKPITPALLIYADLLNSGYDRNIEIAKHILDNELQHIK